MARSHELGKEGERLAAALLERDGWTIIARNVRYGRREIDLIARRGRLVAFVEVKTRRGCLFGDPLHAITPLKRREIELVARWWMARHGRDRDRYRFDAVSVLWQPGATPRLDHIEDAWQLEPS